MQHCPLSAAAHSNGARLTREEHFSPFDGFAGPGARPLHQRPLLWQQQVVFGLVDQVSAALVGLDEQVRAHRAHQELGVQQRHTDVLQDLNTAEMDGSVGRQGASQPGTTSTMLAILIGGHR